MTNKEKLSVSRIKGDFKMNRSIYGMMLVVAVWLFIFSYLPMYGIIISFMDYRPALGIMGSKWVGLKHFETFLTSPSFFRILKNTVKINLYALVFNFPAPIILAILLNELKSRKFVRVVQNFTYLPHFISLVVVCAMIKEFTMDRGVIGLVTKFFGGEAKTLLNYKEYFIPVYVISGIWEQVGWGSVIYFAALTGIDAQLYEAAEIDGAGYWKKLVHVTLPGIKSTIIIMLILRLGSILNVSFEKILLLYNDATMEVADVISTYVYRRGLVKMDMSYSSAIGLFSSVINILFLTGANFINKKANEESLW